MYERILIPTDGSTGTAHVAMQALDLAEQYGGTLHVLNVVETHEGSLLSEVGGSQDELERSGQRAVERIERMAEVHGVGVETAVREGDPAEEILDYADEIEADAIVAGTHGRSGIARRLIGSVAERLVRHASCPVMTVRLPETDVIVDDEQQARDLAEQALSDADHDGEVTAVERQLNVWVADAETDGETLVVYVDPVSQRTSVVERD
jgi:nucleotide-binding universal stress UspA family protein